MIICSQSLVTLYDYSVFDLCSYINDFLCLIFAGEFYYYKTRQDYRSPDSVALRVEARPLELDEYVVKYFNSSGTGAATAGALTESGSVTGSDKGVASNRNSTRVPVFQFTLVPINGQSLRHYGLRCDTEEEFTRWLETMQAVSLTNFEESLALKM